MFFDPLYFILVGPAILLSMYAQYKVKSTFKRYSEVEASSNATGAQVARVLLDRNGLSDITVEPVEGELTDHYDPRSKVLRLSQPIYNGRSLAALGIAAHEAGHAVQDGTGYVPMRIRAGLVPAAGFGSSLAPMLIMIGIVLLYGGAVFGNLLLQVGIVLFAAAVLFQVVTLPVEFNASNRALQMLTGDGFIRSNELAATKKVLSAAALTYLAAALAAVSQLIYFILLSQRRR